jgi:hypothetical protein
VLKTKSIYFAYEKTYSTLVDGFDIEQYNHTKRHLLEVVVFSGVMIPKKTDKHYFRRIRLCPRHFCQDLYLCPDLRRPVAANTVEGCLSLSNFKDLFLMYKVINSEPRLGLVTSQTKSFIHMLKAALFCLYEAKSPQEPLEVGFGAELNSLFCDPPNNFGVYPSFEDFVNQRYTLYHK